MPEGKEHPKFDPPLDLMGGMLSGNGSGSFRGKQYADIIMEVTGESLYHDLDANRLRMICDKLENTPYNQDWGTEEKSPNFGYPCSEHDYNDLRRMFRGYMDAGATLYAFY